MSDAFTCDRIGCSGHCRTQLISGGAGDTTLNLLWRVQNGEGPVFSPKVAVLLIGTNDLTNPVYALVSIPLQEETRTESSAACIFPSVPSDVSAERAALHAGLKNCTRGLSRKF